jgi:hypothetical protein
MPATGAARKLVIVLPDPDFQILAQLAEDKSRTVDQQAQHLVRQGLRRRPPRDQAAHSAEAPPDVQ